MPFRGSDSLGPFLTVWVDPHFGQLGTSPLMPLNSGTGDRIEALVEAGCMTFSEGFFSTVGDGAGLAAISALNCAIVLSIKASRSSAARLSVSAFFRVLPPVTAFQEVSIYR